MGRRSRRNNSDLVGGVALILAVLAYTNPEPFKEYVIGFSILIFVTASIIGLVFLNKKNKSHSIKRKATGIRHPINTQSQTERDLYPFSRISDYYSSKWLSEEKRNVIQGWSIELIKSLEWKRFEELCAGYFNIKGYNARVTRQGADGGVDIHLYKESYSSSKPFGIVQCKAWNAYKVGIKPVRELYGVMASEKVPLGIFITSGEYTNEARDFSEGKHLKLLTGETLLNLIKSVSEENKKKLLKDITKGDYMTPSCPSCGEKMVLRAGKKKNCTSDNKFWGCRNFPRCRNALRVKQA